ncbi:hypothetical protein AB0F77_36520 [Streptomyces sp. NPDC026672]|uniref:hypothetical protein n=1 Tax=unclassified Streptomyces TaxID=2593676 RepID=UPI0033EB8930
MTQSGQGEPAREGIVLPSDGGEPLLPGAAGGPAAPLPAAPSGHGPASAPPGGQAWGQPWGPGQEQQQPQIGQGWSQAADQWGTEQPAAWNAGQGAGPLPAEGAPAPSYDQGGYPGSYGQGADGARQAYGQGPDAAHAGYGQPYAANGADGYGAPGGAALPQAHQAAENATQYLPPVANTPVDEGATQFIPPVPAAPVDEGATQYIPPVGPGAMPHAEAATQYIPPVPGGYGEERQPPAEFDNLFRDGSEGQAPSTQQLPRFEQPQAPYGGRPQQSYGGPQEQGAGGGRRGAQADEGGRGGRSRVPLIAAVGVGIAVLGIGAGALLSGGGDGDQDTDNAPVAASAPAADGSPGADPAQQQAAELDKLLADSGSSRASVIKAVADVKSCDNLDGAAADLRDAAKQRAELVTRLSKLSVDKLPENAALTDALTKAWQASASADNHYAAWADQTAAKHGCRKGQARSTAQTQEGNRASGTASTEKSKAAGLWNTIAEKYGLTERQPTQL